MRLQDLGFLGLGSAPWGTSSPSTAGSGSSNGNSALTGAGSSSSIGSTLSSALSNSLTGSAAELAVVRESETLKIQLTDGSQVTIRVRAQGAAFGAAQTQADGSSSSAAGILASGKLQISVDGNLSSADMQAINDVVSQVNSLAAQFFSGNVQDAFAAAASLSIDPAEIAGFSMKLSYTSMLIQQAAASGAAPGAGATYSTPTGSAATPAGANTTSSPTDASGATPGTPDSQTVSPQQIIIDFIQTALTKLGRGPADAPSQLRVASRWKLHLLAQALPAYAQAQSAGATAAGTTDTTTPAAPATAAQNAQPAGISAAVAAAPPQVSSNRYPTLQAARLAADTLSQLAQ